MPIKIPNEGEKLLLQWSLKQSASFPALKLRLYTNNYTPLDSSETADFTEATFTGYAAKDLARASWGDAATNVDGKAEMSYGTAQSWNATSAETVYGYYITTNDVDNVTVWAERFSTARALANGDSLTLQPKLTGKTEN